MRTEGVQALVLALLVAAAAAASAAPAPSPDQPSQEAQQAELGVLGPAASPSSPLAQLQAEALSPSAVTSACPEETVLVYASQLVNLTQTNCNQNGAVNDQAGRFDRGTPFGFAWNDTLPADCTIFTVTLALQAGISCTGLPGGGPVTLNGQLLPSKYRFPYVNEYDGDCSCVPPVYSPIQVFNLAPGNAYRQGSLNTFSILGSTGTNGLKPLVPQATGGLYAVVIINQIAPTGYMQVPRTNFGFVGTPGGLALAAGGISQNGLPTATAEEYNRTTQSWQLSSGSLQTAVSLNQLANLQAASEAPDSSGAYYIVSVGGIDATGTQVAAMDIYNTTSHKWSPGVPMTTPRSRFQLTPLYNGTNAVVATGGVQGSAGETTVLGSAEAYDLDTNVWRVGPNNMSAPRYRHTASLVPGWQLLVAGGQGQDTKALNSSEIFSLTDFQWSRTGSLHQARYAHTATVLQNGSVLVTGGAQKPNSDATWSNADLLASCELWTNGTWTPVASLITPRAEHVAVLQSDGTVVVSGGANSGGQAVPAVEIWSPVNGQWSSAAPLLVPRVRFGAVRFPDDRQLLFGGSLNATQTLVNGTTVSSIFAPAVNSTILLASQAPVVAPALSPAQAASSPVLNNSSVASPPSSAAGPALPPNSYFIYAPSGLSTGAVIGVVVAAVGGFALLLGAALLVFCCIRRRRRAAQQRLPGSSSKPGSTGYRGSSRAGSEFGGSRNLSGGESCGHCAHTEAEAAGGASLLRRLLAAFGRKPARGTQPQATDSIELPKGLASPFDAPPNTAGSDPPKPYSGPIGFSGGSVELAAGLPSPFESPVTTVSTNGKPSAPATGGSQAVTTQTTAHSRETEDRVEAFTQATRSRSRTGPPFSSGVASTRSDLSRVSATIQNELHAAEWRIERDALELGRLLGKGGFGEVYEGTHHGSAVAIKVLEINDERAILDACHEFGFLHGLRHSKLVISYGACVDGNKMLLVMERMEEDLFHAIASDRTMADDSVLWYFRGWRIAVDVASSLVFLHSKGMVHLDVKSLNILLKGRRSEAKLGDLGLARMVPEGALFLQNTLPGTPAYSAPEVMQAQLQWRLRTQGRKDQFKTEVGTPADIFAFGVVLFEICTGCHPARWRQEFTGELRPEQGPPAIARLIDDCLNDEPQLRPSAQQVLRILMENRPPNYRD